MCLNFSPAVGNRLGWLCVPSYTNANSDLGANAAAGNNNPGTNANSHLCATANSDAASSTRNASDRPGRS